MIIFKDILKDAFKGVVIGIANIIPGVSGGTMALVLGIYERLIDAIGNITPKAIIILLKGLSFKPEARAAFRAEYKRLDLWFLAKLGAGAAVAVLLFTKVLKSALQFQHDPTYGFFLGLVLVSALAPYKLLKAKGVGTVVFIILGTLAVLGFSLIQNDADLLAKAQHKHRIELAKKAKVDSKKAGESGGVTALLESLSNSFEKFKNRSIGGHVKLFLWGLIAISAMVLPGVSGSFLLLMMGGYFEVMDAISERDVFTLGVFAMGCLVGILVFSRFLNYLLHHWHDQTMSFLVGLVVGSLWVLWPFKTSALVGDKTIYLASNIMPAGFGANEILTVFTFLIGCVMVGALLWLEARQDKAAN